MPEANQIVFGYTEIVENLIKAAGVHEGKWMLLVNFTFTAGNFGPDEKTAFPGALVGINQLGLAKADAFAPKSMIVDASIVNPPQEENNDDS